MAIIGHKVYVAVEGDTLDFNSPNVMVMLPDLEIDLPDDFPSFPNPEGLKFKSLKVSWYTPTVETRNYQVGVTAVDESGMESSMGIITKTLETDPEPVIEV